MTYTISILHSLAGLGTLPSSIIKWPGVTVWSHGCGRKRTRNIWPAAPVTSTIWVSDYQIGPLSRLQVRHSHALPQGDNPGVPSSHSTCVRHSSLQIRVWYQVVLTSTRSRNLNQKRQVTCCSPLPPHCILIHNGETKVGVNGRHPFIGPQAFPILKQFWNLQGFLPGRWRMFFWGPDSSVREDLPTALLPSSQ